MSFRKVLVNLQVPGVPSDIYVSPTGSSAGGAARWSFTVFHVPLFSQQDEQKELDEITAKRQKKGKNEEEAPAEEKTILHGKWRCTLRWRSEAGSLSVAELCLWHTSWSQGTMLTFRCGVLWVKLLIVS